jgi:hypothetical protein
LQTKKDSKALTHRNTPRTYLIYKSDTSKLAKRKQ